MIVCAMVLSNTGQKSASVRFERNTRHAFSKSARARPNVVADVPSVYSFGWAPTRTGRPAEPARFFCSGALGLQSGLQHLNGPPTMARACSICCRFKRPGAVLMPQRLGYARAILAFSRDLPIAVG